MSSVLSGTGCGGAARRYRAWMRAFIIGGSGLVGRAISRRLLSAGWDVDVLARNAANLPRDLADAGVRLVETVALSPGRRILNSADPDAPSGLEIARTVAKYLGHEWAEILLDDDADPSLGWHPWDRKYPVVLDTTAAVELGYRPVGDYAATVPGVINWLISTAHGADAAQLPAGFGDEYFADRFDYPREDASLVSH